MLVSKADKNPNIFQILEVDSSYSLDLNPAVLTSRYIFVLIN